MRYAITALLSLFFATGLQAQSFTVHEFSAGAGPMDNVRADFNRDGIADLANVNNHSSSVSVLLGNGDGTFRAPLQSAAGEAPVALAVVDLNNDRIPDLVTANQDPDADHSLSVLIGNGDGTFQTHRDFNITTGDPPVGIVAADFNRDGNPDTAVAFHSGTLNYLSVNFGDGAGGLGPGHVFVGWGREDEPGEDHRVTHIALGDFNNDGKKDIAFTECCGGFDVEVGDVGVLLGNGDGTFSQGVIADLSVPQDLTIADLNQDSYSDMVVPFEGCHTPCLGVRAYVNNRDGTFNAVDAADFSFDQYFNPAAAAVTDINGDGYRDINVGIYNIGLNGEFPQRNTIATLLGRPNGTYANPVEVTIGTNKRPLATAVGDYNRDGKRDLATANFNSDTTSVLLNKTKGSTCKSGSTDRTVTLCLPKSNATLANPVHLLAGTTDKLQVTGMKVYVDSVARMFVPEDLLNGRLNLATGSHKVTVRAWDALGSFSKTVSVNVTACGSTAPERSVSICTPLGGTVHNPVRIRAVVKDSAYVVSSLQIYVDGVKKFSVAARELDTTLTLAVGRRRIAVKAFDEISSFTTVVYVTVQ